MKSKDKVPWKISAGSEMAAAEQYAMAPEEVK